MIASHFKMKCSNVMGMPTDTVTCGYCGAKKTVWGEGTIAKMEAWAEEHEKECGRVPA